MKKFLILFFLIFFCSILYSQNVRIEQLRSYNDTTEALRTRKIWPIDVQKYIAVGGTFHGLIDQIDSDDNSTIVISDNITATTSIPSNIHLTFTADGSLTNTEIISILGDIDAQRKKIFNNTVNLSQSKVKEVYPEWWGAKVNDANDDVTAIENSFTQAKGKTVSLTSGTYEIDDTMFVDVQGQNVLVYGDKETLIKSTLTPTNYNYYKMPGVFKIVNGGRVEIRDLRVQSVNAGDEVTQGDNGISVIGCNDVIIENVDSRYAGYAGIYVERCNSVSMSNCNGDSTMYAGAMFREVYQLNIKGGSYSYNGSYGTVTGVSNYNAGYGIALAGKWNVSGSVGLRNIEISGCKIWYNYRSSISGHGGSSVNIHDNSFLGWGNQGYASINYSDNYEDQSYASWQQNINVHNNTFVQDSLWALNILFHTDTYNYQGEYNAATHYDINDCVYYGFSSYQSLTDNNYANTPDSSPSDWAMVVSDISQQVVTVGAYGVTTQYQLDYNSGSSIVSDNIFYNISHPTLNSVIEVKVNRRSVTGSYITGVDINHNQISECYYPRYAAIYVGSDEGAIDNPEALDINHNTINGNGHYGLLCLAGKAVDISGNHVNGVWQEPISCTVPYTRSKNTYNGIPLADINLERSYTSYLRNGGKFSFQQETTNDTVTIQYLTVDNDWSRYYDRDGIVFKAQITGTYFYNTNHFIWEGLASIGWTGEPANEGNWDSETEYSMGQFVIYGNNYWESLQDNNISHTPVNGSWWLLYYGNELITNDTMSVVNAGGDSWAYLYPPTLVWEDKGDNKRTLCINFKHPYTNYYGTIEWTGGNYAFYSDTLFADTLKTPLNLASNTWRSHSKDIGRYLYGNLDANTKNIINAGAVQTKALFSTPVQLSGTSPVIDWSLGNKFYQTLSGNTLLSFSNTQDGQLIKVFLTNTTGNWTVDFIDTSIVWAGGTQPTQSIGNVTDIWGFERIGDFYFPDVKQNYYKTSSVSTISQYNVVEESFTHTGTYTNPYSEVYATAILTSPTSIEDSIPLFWNGGSTWKMRFSPNQLGNWTYIIEATDAGLNGRTGSFNVISSSKKGTIKKDPSYPYHFVRQDGSRFWFLGDTQWNLFRTIPYDSLNTETIKDYIDLRNSQGYNVIHFVTNTDEQWLDVEQDDMDTLNLTFFQNGDDRLQYLNDSTSNEMIGGLLISWANERGDGTWRDWDNFTTAEQRTRYLRYIIGRYSAYNIYFILSGEFDETAIPVDWDDLGTQLKAYDPHNRMVAMHPGAIETSEQFADLAWAGFGDYQQTAGATANAAIIEARDHSKPVVNSEYSYYMCDRDSNGSVDNWYEIMPFTRTVAWRIAFAGGYFVTGYGATVLGGLRHDWAFTNWDNPIYDDWELQVGYIKSFFANKEYWKLTPTDELYSGGGNGDVFCLYENDKQYYYHADSIDATLYADLTGASGIYNSRRLNTRTGAYTDLGQENGGGLVEMVVPDAQDYVFEFMLCDTCTYQDVDTTSYIATMYITSQSNDGYWETTAFEFDEPLLGFGNIGGDSWSVWTRFNNVQIPRNQGIGYAHRTIIDSARLYFTADGERLTTTCNLNIYACDTSSSAIIASIADYQARTLTSAVAWNAVEGWYDDQLYYSPDIKTLIQTIVDRPDWTSGNALQLFVKDNSSDADARRRAFSFDNGEPTPSDVYPYLKIYYRTIDSVSTPPEAQVFDVPIRAFYTELRAADTTEENLEWLRTDFVAEGFNTLILQVDYGFEYETYPYLRASSYVGKPFIQRLVNACDSAGIILVPHFTCFGHQGDGVDLYPLLDYYPGSFDAQPDEVGSPSDVRSWNPLNDSVITVTDSLMKELVSAFSATKFSIGFDEILMAPYTGSAYYNSETWDQIYANEQKRIVDSLRVMGVDTIYMWGDRLLKNSVWSLGSYESNSNESANQDMTLAIDDIYQDSIIIADWHYNASPATPEYFAGLAFNVASVQWKSSSGDSWQPGLDHLARYINADAGIKDNMLGLISANWRGLNKCRLAYYKLPGYEEEVKEYMENARIVMSQWRDDDTPVYQAGEQTIHPTVIEDTDSIYIENDDGQVLELGVKFELTLAGAITKVRIYVGENEGGDHTVRIWDTDANEVLSGPHTWTITAGTAGWKEYTLPTPLSVQADVGYTLSVSTSTDYMYSKAIHYWYAPRTTNNIITFRDSGVYTTNVGSMPTASSNQTTYYRDIICEVNE